MRREDAPASGWYPDPQSRTSLRYWDGLDWTDAWRAPPSKAELLSYENKMAEFQPFDYRPEAASAELVSHRTVDSQQVIDEVRRATREEIDRAAEMFTERAQSMRRDIEPLISQYTNRLVKWIRFAAIVAVILLVAYFVFQVIAQASLFEWIGDRIDNLTDDQNGAGLLDSW
ncbi:MAG: DUF2510 domain-containing protein [Ilumatobacteraceae bacterium]